MYEKFTDRARKVMQLSNQEAQRFNHEYIGTEHVLLGLAKEGTGLGAIVLKELGVDLGSLRAEIEKIVPCGPDMVTMGKLPQTPRVKQAMEAAVKEAASLKHHYVGTEHILLGLISSDVGGVACEMLKNFKLTPEIIRAKLLALLEAGVKAEPTNERPCESYAVVTVQVATPVVWIETTEHISLESQLSLAKEVKAKTGRECIVLPPGCVTPE